jgi:membrane protein DedA with SNARE-associated domain
MKSTASSDERSSERSEAWILRAIVILTSGAFLSHRFDWFSEQNPWYLNLLAFGGVVFFVIALAIMDETRRLRARRM